MSSDTPIYLSEEEAKTFILFQKYRKIFEYLEKERLLEMSEASFEVHLGTEGKIRLVDIHSHCRF